MVFLGQSFGYPFKPEHSAGHFSKCQSHFWLWTDSLMDHCDESVCVCVLGARALKEEEMENKGKTKEKQVYVTFCDN